MFVGYVLYEIHFKNYIFDINKIKLEIPVYKTVIKEKILKDL